MEITAKLKYFRMAPRKVRLVADLIRGMDTKEAKAYLKVTNKKIAEPLLKLLNSAIANAENNFNLDKDNLYISKIMVNGGPTLKRWMPRAYGRANEIKKRTSHITIVLDEKVKSKKRKQKNKETTKKISQESIKKAKEKSLEEKSKKEEKLKKTGFFQRKDDKGQLEKARRNRFASFRDRFFHRKGNM